MKLQPYLNFDGRCAEAFRFYQTLLGGQLEMMTHGESPAASQVPAEWKDAILHATLVVGDAVLMGCDAPPTWYQAPKGSYVSITVETPADAERIYDALVEGGAVHMPMQETFWSPRFGMVADRFGVPWMVNCEASPQSPRQAQKNASDLASSK
ncbi:MAG TPA: VOC family protein [Longimicrobiales bacterium]|nr:VOC family protein [Longimicrobiales bacterium]